MSKTKKQLIAEQTELLQTVEEYRSALDDERYRSSKMHKNFLKLQDDHAKLERLYQSVADDTTRFYKDAHGNIIETVGNKGEAEALKVKVSQLERDNDNLKKMLERHRTNSNYEMNRGSAQVQTYKEVLGLVLDKALR